MKIIDNEKIQKLNINVEDFYTWAKETLLLKDKILLPAKISMKKDNHIFFNIMPCIIDKTTTAGVKIVSRFPNRKPSLDSQIIIYNSKTGENLAFLDGNVITAYRTGAVAALSINYLAVKNYKTIAVMGLGNVTRATFKILLKTIPEKRIKLKVLKYKDQAEEFIKWLNNPENIDFEIVDNYKDLIADSDVIISGVTSADQNFGQDEWFKEGCLVVPIHTMGFQNCDLFFDKFIVDDINHTKDFKYFKEFKEVHELAEIIKDPILARNNDKQRIIAYNVGNANFDIYFAKKIFDMLEKDNLMDIDLKSPKDKFWI